jgi:predicted RNase H-like nuclease (RuvC/YqgF family)
MEIILKNLSTIITMVVAPIITWFVITKPYQKKDLEKRDIENDASQVVVISQNLDIYQRMLDDMEQRSEAKFQKLYKEIEALEKEKEALKSRVKQLESELEKRK